MPRSLQFLYDLSRRDAVSCAKHGSNVESYKNSQEYADRAARRAKQGNGFSPKRPHSTGRRFADLALIALTVLLGLAISGCSGAHRVAVQPLSQWQTDHPYAKPTMTIPGTGDALTIHQFTDDVPGITFASGADHGHYYVDHRIYTFGVDSSGTIVSGGQE